MDSWNSFKKHCKFTKSINSIINTINAIEDESFDLPIDNFVSNLEKQSKLNKNNKIFKIMYKFYPVYNFNYTNPPTGNDINQCQSELLN